MKKLNTNHLKKRKTTRSTKDPLVSVIIPVFNGASFLVEAVESAQKSTFSNFEILLIDDGSTDNSKKLCQMMEKTYDNVYFYSFSNNRGLGRILNFALKKARGKYICRLNQDDRMLPHRLKTQVAYLSNHSETVAVGSSIYYFEDTNEFEKLTFLETDQEIKDMWHIVSPFSDPSVMYNKEVAIQAGGYQQEFWPADDTHLWYRMGMLGKLANLAKPVVEVRWHDKAASVYHFRKLALSTYKMHRWAHQHVSVAPVWVQMYWIGQLMSGIVLPPQFNWKVYRWLKKGIALYENMKTRSHKIMLGNRLSIRLSSSA